MHSEALGALVGTPVSTAPSEGVTSFTRAPEAAHAPCAVLIGHMAVGASPKVAIVCAKDGRPITGMGHLHWVAELDGTRTQNEVGPTQK